MNKKSLFGLLLFASIVMAGLFFGAMIMTKQPATLDYSQSLQESNDDKIEDYVTSKKPDEDTENDQNKDLKIAENDKVLADAKDSNAQESLSVNKEVTQPDKTDDDKDRAEDSLRDENTLSEDAISSVEGDNVNNDKINENNGSEKKADGEISSYTDSTNTLNDTEEVLSDNILELPDMQLITDCSQVDYMDYIPEMIFNSKIEIALDIINPTIDIKAKSAILFDVNTGEVLYYKDPILPVFPASTAKLLTTLVALDWCNEDEAVTVGDEIDLVAPDSTKAGLKKGQVLSFRNLIEGMLVPSGNDAAYVTAAYVGRKSLKNVNASLKEAIYEFVRLMNDKAKNLGTVNSCFKTPDGYDAIGQYTTAYDMGLIGLEAAKNDIILDVCKKSKARNVFIDGNDVTWTNTNSLIKKSSGRYYQYCIGLKTGTSTMAGKCLISLAKKGEKEVLSVVMNSDSQGRWDDSRKLLDYGLSN